MKNFNFATNKLLAVLLIFAFTFTSFGASPPLDGFKYEAPQATKSKIVDSILTAPRVRYAMDENFGTLLTLDSNLTTNANVIVLGYSQPARIYTYKSAFILSSVTVTTPAAETFTCVAATDVCTAATGNVVLLGLKGQGTTTTTLPGGLSTSTDYFMIPVTSTTFKLATSYANAVAGTAINITDTGTGTHTFTAVAIAGGTISLQGSIDGTTFADITSSSSNVTATAKFYWNISDTFYPFVRVKYVNTAGVFTADTKYAAKF